MREFLDELEKRIYKLRQVIVSKKQSLLTAPEGSIHIAATDTRVQFYLKQGNKRKYMKESERMQVKRLCQKDYDQKVLKSAEWELAKLEKLRAGYEVKACETVYNDLHTERQKLVEPIELSDEEFVKQWEATEYHGKGFSENTPEFYTDRGERVRSKTEILIANALYKHYIPYRYEASLKLDGYGIVHPDFTVLNVRLRKEIYFEHMGMLDDEDYREYALDKIIAYEKNGYFPGDKLVLTHETLKNPMNSRLIEKVIEQYFL